MTRDELRSRLWPQDVFIDHDHALNKAISKLRTTLGDVSARARFVETLSRRGYRFIAPVDGAAAHPPATVVRLLSQGRTIALPAGIHLIGREETVAVPIDSPTVSRRHARLVVNPPTTAIEDLGSKNGTRVSGRRIRESTPLDDGDLIRAGSVELTFRCAGSRSTDTMAGSSEGDDGT